MNAPHHTSRRRVDGVLLFDKPAGLTSNTALQKVRRLYAAAKAGHTGTLDPMATGLLPVCFGEATKFSSQLLDADKTYHAELHLGVTTDTADAEGRELLHRPVRATEGDLVGIMRKFTGSIEQIPPMHSALKRDGRPLYEYARKGIEIERRPRSVRIHVLKLLEFSGVRAVIEVSCSKGTYIRTLAEDIGEALGCGAHLSALRRIRIGSTDLSEAHTLAELESVDMPRRDSWLAPVDALLDGLPRQTLDALQAQRFVHGQAVTLVTSIAGRCRTYGPDDDFLGLGEGREDGHLHPSRLLALPEEYPENS